MNVSMTLAEAERASMAAQYSEAAIAEIAGLKKERDFLTLEVGKWKRLAGVTLGDPIGAKRSERVVVDELRDIAYGLCQSAGKTCFKELDAYDMYKAAFVGYQLPKVRKLNYWNQFLRQERVRLDNAKKVKENGGTVRVGAEGRDQETGADDGFLFDDFDDEGDIDDDFEDQPWLTLMRLKWNGLTTLKRQRFCEHVDRVASQVHGEKAKKLSKLQVTRKIEEMEQALDNAVVTLSFYDVEAIIVVLPNYRCKYKEYEGAILHSSIFLRNIFARQFLRNEEAPDAALLLVLKTQLDKVLRQVVEVEREAPAPPAVARNLNKADTHARCKIKVLKALNDALPVDKKLGEVPWSFMWDYCVKYRITYATETGVSVKIHWPMFGMQRKGIWDENYQLILSDDFKFRALDPKGSTDDFERLKELNASSLAFHEAKKRVTGGAGNRKAFWEYFDKVWPDKLAEMQLITECEQI